jgi:type IV secretion system protein VirD4
MTTDTPIWVKITIGAVVFIVATALGIYLAGVFILIAAKTNPAQANFLTFYQYWYHFHEAVEYQKRLNVSAIIAAIIAYGLPLAIYAKITHEARSLHGAARFANSGEVEKSGLLGEQGIIVGKWKSRYLMLPGQQFVLLSAPTRSGKGVGIVIPNLLNWPDSVVVLDVKQEN